MDWSKLKKNSIEKAKMKINEYMYLHYSKAVAIHLEIAIQEKITRDEISITGNRRLLKKKIL